MSKLPISQSSKLPKVEQMRGLSQKIFTKTSFVSQKMPTFAADLEVLYFG